VHLTHGKIKMETILADKLNVNTGGTAAGNKIWDMHQKDEQKRVNNHKEGFCWRCEKKKAVSATLFNVCEHCRRNRGHEFTLVTVADKGWDMCMFCGRYDWSIKQMNARLCYNCHYKVRETLRDFRRAGGTTKVDPFWKSMRRNLGKDFLFQDGFTRHYRK
jgi:hypothetical protein